MMKKFLFVLSLLLLLPGFRDIVEDHQLDAQSTASYGVVVTSLTTSSAGVVTGTNFAVPSSYAAIITWQVIADGSALSVNLESSNDNVTYTVVDSQTTALGGLRNYGFTATKFVRCSQVSRTGGTNTSCTLVISRGLVSTGAGTISSGRFLTNDGSAGAPAYSFLSQPNTGFYFLNGNTVFTKSAVVKWLYGATELGYGSGYSIGWSSQADPTNGGNDTSLVRGGAAGKVLLTGTTPMLLLGGTTSSFPAIKQVSNTLQVRTADDTAYGTFTMAVVNLVTGLTNANNGSLVLSVVNPTISSGFGTSPSIVTPNGTTSFLINVGTGAVASSGIIGLPTATNGWNCSVSDTTANGAHTALQSVQTSGSTTSATIESQNRATGAATAWAASSILRVSCFAY